MGVHIIQISDTADQPHCFWNFSWLQVNKKQSDWKALY